MAQTRDNFSLFTKHRPWCMMTHDVPFSSSASSAPKAHCSHCTHRRTQHGILCSQRYGWDELIRSSPLWFVLLNLQQLVQLSTFIMAGSNQSSTLALVAAAAALAGAALMTVHQKKKIHSSNDSIPKSLLSSPYSQELQLAVQLALKGTQTIYVDWFCRLVMQTSYACFCVKIHFNRSLLTIMIPFYPYSSWRQFGRLLSLQGNPSRV